MAVRHLKELIAAHKSGDDLAFRRAVNEIIEEEEAKNHGRVALELRKLLAATGSQREVYSVDPGTAQAPMDSDSGVSLIAVSEPSRRVSSLALGRPLVKRLTGIISEVSKWPSLDNQGIPRRQRVLLYGPPGCGKTSIAAALAHELGMALAVVRLDAIVSSFLGETSANLRKVFDYAAENRVVLLLDEFDALGKVRSDPADHGEHRRIVNATLQLMDGYSGASLIVAATNHQGDLDPAVWRRFDEVLEVPLPDADQVRRVLARILGTRRTADDDLTPIAEELVGLPHAAAEKVAWDARRAAALTGRDCCDATDLDAGLAEVRSRRWF
jgi:SpoVK/Ycf46/Vps4 family AAA+-type ATPase